MACNVGKLPWEWPEASAAENSDAVHPQVVGGFRSWAVLAAFSGETARRVVERIAMALEDCSAPERREDAAARRRYLSPVVKYAR